MKKTLVKKINESTIVQRWKGELNDFWKVILRICLTLAVSSAGVLEVNSFFELNLPPMIITVCGYVLATAGGMGLAAKLTKK